MEMDVSMELKSLLRRPFSIDMRSYSTQGSWPKHAVSMHTTLDSQQQNKSRESIQNGGSSPMIIILVITFIACSYRRYVRRVDVCVCVRVCVCVCVSWC